VRGGAPARIAAPGRGALPVQLPRGVSARCAAKREDKGSLVPSRQVTLRNRRVGNCIASARALSGRCSGRHVVALHLLSVEKERCASYGGETRMLVNCVGCRGLSGTLKDTFPQ
jgi:hypothetical protein